MLSAANEVLDAEGNKCLSSTYVPADPEALTALASKGERLARNADGKDKKKESKKANKKIEQFR